jgi:hypothetical protein
MNCQAYDERLGDYVDGTLPAEALQAVETHLAVCARCRSLVTDFQTVRAMTLSLEPEVPSPHVWTRLSSALELTPRRWAFLPALGFGWQPVGAGAMAVVLATGLWWVGGRLAPLSRQTGPGSVAGAGMVAGTDFVNTEFRTAEEHFTTAISGLEQITGAERAVLDPETADLLQTNLTMIDHAIGESRAALQTEPENDLVQESLFAALRSKIVLLQDTLALINAMRQGNQDGAARILSDVNP